MAAWRPYDNLISGELDNTQPGRVMGRLRFVGMNEDVTLDLEGDFHRDIRGTVIRISNENPSERHPGYMEGFATHQTGQVGDITAGLPPQDYADYPYIEWYSDQNGRIVLELRPEQVQVIGTPIPWETEPPLSREEQARNMGNFLAGLSASLGAPAIVVGGMPEQTTSGETQPVNEKERSAQQVEPEQDQDHEQEISR
jgi:hypothetical protein